MLQRMDLVYKWDEKVKNAVKIGSEIRWIMGEFLRNKGFIEISPVMISSITDPLAHPIFDGKIEYYGKEYYLTRSMIFHKQIALLSFKKIFCFSPNIRLEMAEKASTGRHLIEFTQLDLEIRNATRDEVMSLAEEMLVEILKRIKEKCEEELEFFGRKLRLPSIPFKRIKFAEAYEKYGEEYEEILSSREKCPFWIIDFPKWKREFYDREYEDKGGYLIDMDLIYPEGFGEGISGGEREYEYEKIVKRMKEKGEKMEEYSSYLAIALKGLHPSAGFGIGMERLIRYICGIGDISRTTLFPKIPGKICI